MSSVSSVSGATTTATTTPGTAASATTPELWAQYRNNLSRHLIGVSRYLQTGMMSRLQIDCGHSHLRLGFAPYMTLIGERGRRLSDLAETLGISRQACNQAIKQIENAGYVGRRADPEDGRAKRLVLTAQGKRLRRDGARVVRDFDQQFSDMLGEGAYTETAGLLQQLHRHLALGLTPEGADGITYEGIGAFLPRLSDFTMQRLMDLTRERGHPALKLSFGQVLTLIGPAGGRIQRMAALQDVSKQAISAIAVELEELGYLRRETDPGDARQVLLHFTQEGEALIADSVAGVADLESEFTAMIGAGAVSRLKKSMGELYRGLLLEQDVFENTGTSDIVELARQLKRQLGDEGSGALARLLLQTERPLR